MGSMTRRSRRCAVGVVAPNEDGSAAHAHPVCSTYKIAAITVRSVLADGAESVPPDDNRRNTIGPFGNIRSVSTETSSEAGPTDADLCAGAAESDRVAFARLFDRHVQAVARHCFRLSGSWPSAEDLTQSTFLTAWRRRRDIRIVAGSALPWLLTVANNTVGTEWRARRRWLAAIRRMPVATGVDDPADEIAGRIDDQRRMRPILAAVRRLPRAEREAIALCVWSGLSYTDAAQALGIAEASVRSRVSRAKSRLAVLLGPPTDVNSQQEER